MAMASAISGARSSLALAAVLASLPHAVARLGDANTTQALKPLPNLTMSKSLAPGGAGRGREFWKGVQTLSASDVAGEAERMGFEYVATTTVYADTDRASCGSIDTAAAVSGTGYYAVASAQAMQNMFPGGGCCWCGQAGSSCGHGSGTAPMGCMACARGRFINRRPYEAPPSHGQGLFQEEVNLVVVDICPHTGNEAWCPEREGSENVFGSRNHFDFAHPPAGFDNHYLAFSPVPCPGEIQQRLMQMSQCGR